MQQLTFIGSTVHYFFAAIVSEMCKKKKKLKTLNKTLVVRFEMCSFFLFFCFLLFYFSFSFHSIFIGRKIAINFRNALKVNVKKWTMNKKKKRTDGARKGFMEEHEHKLSSLFNEKTGRCGKCWQDQNCLRFLVCAYLFFFISRHFSFCESFQLVKTVKAIKLFAKKNFQNFDFSLFFWMLLIFNDWFDDEVVVIVSMWWRNSSGRFFSGG